ncbi:conserved hypothetical protein [Cellulomonas flavigena DSM 20109]|uniref:Antitoxin n=1 Tax=Cellulomonas flavigena (strain ATCC 482 / DSM 20109 / BCRC 11376 / JCM 18109 / NBRC 3775 / NCIMB 8073 / NRS 134) TaxID=446466 RepID=D5UKM4_CELFN|nr:hypothetical protein [Cellulomonas flavigena]ADG73842.1 conserved hypothetical protein [Cellulomonas flavigena DSM 20109]
MPDILVRGLSEAAVAHFDAEAASLGLSRAEVLRRHLEAEVRADAPRPTMTPDDWDRFAREFGDLGDPEVMASAWR